MNFLRPNSQTHWQYLAILAGLGLLAASAIWWVGRYQKLDDPWQSFSVVSPAPWVTNELESWQTYRNEEYGFEFQYPTTLSPQVSQGALGSFSLSLSDGTFHSFFVEIGAENNPEIEGLIYPKPSSYDSIASYQVRLGSVTWEKTEVQEYPREGLGMPGSITSYWIKRGGNVYVVGCINCVEKIFGKERMDIFEGIVASFRFMD